MHALIRRISAYTAPDVLLGIFANKDAADHARGVYLAKYSADPASDPWRAQAYKTDGLNADDLQTVSVDGAGSPQNGDVAIVVSRYEEMFGQISRDLDSVHLSEASAQARIAEIEQTQSDVVSYALAQRIRVDILESDRPEHQPRL